VERIVLKLRETAQEHFRLAKTSVQEPASAIAALNISSFRAISEQGAKKPVVTNKEIKPGGKKKRYVPPAVSKMTLEQAKEFLLARSKGNGEPAEDLLESLHRERREKAKPATKTS